MTVATIVASLLPIMWSHRQGAEVMKPLATPVIGGMISSLLHILIVTPVIFLWLREREFRKGTLQASLSTERHHENHHHHIRHRLHFPRFLQAGENRSRHPESTKRLHHDTCLVSGEKLGENGQALPEIVHEGQQIKFCCKSCIPDFEKDSRPSICRS